MQISKQTKQLFLLLLLCIGAYIFFQNEDSLKDTVTTKKSQVEKPTAFIEESEIVSYNKAGERNFVLKSKSALFFESDDKAQIISPHITFTPEATAAPGKQETTNQEIVLQAKNGEYNIKLGTLVLSGNVRANLPQPNGDWVIETPTLLLEKDSHFISTDEEVTITQGDNILKAVGLHAWTDKRKIELLSAVRGRYVLQ